jgi:hypothetical protein
MPKTIEFESAIRNIISSSEKPVKLGGIKTRGLSKRRNENNINHFRQNVRASNDHDTLIKSIRNFEIQIYNQLRAKATLQPINVNSYKTLYTSQLEMLAVAQNDKIEYSNSSCVPFVAHKTAQTKLLNALQRILPQADAQNASVASIGHNTTRG